MVPGEATGLNEFDFKYSFFRAMPEAWKLLFNKANLRVEDMDLDNLASYFQSMEFDQANDQHPSANNNDEESSDDDDTGSYAEVYTNTESGSESGAETSSDDDAESENKSDDNVESKSNDDETYDNNNNDDESEIDDDDDDSQATAEGTDGSDQADRRRNGAKKFKFDPERRCPNCVHNHTYAQCHWNARNSDSPIVKRIVAQALRDADHTLFSTTSSHTESPMTDEAMVAIDPTFRRTGPSYKARWYTTPTVRTEASHVGKIVHAALTDNCDISFSTEAAGGVGLEAEEDE